MRCKNANKLSRKIALMLEVSDYGHMMAKSLILFGPNSNPKPKKYLGFGYKGLHFCRNND